MVDQIEPDVPASDTDVYVPDERAILGAELSRAILKVLAERFGPEFTRDVHDELYARCAAYADSCPEDQDDGEVLAYLLNSPLWDPLMTR